MYCQCPNNYNACVYHNQLTLYPYIPFTSRSIPNSTIAIIWNDNMYRLQFKQLPWSNSDNIESGINSGYSCGVQTQFPELPQTVEIQYNIQVSRYIGRFSILGIFEACDCIFRKRFLFLPSRFVSAIKSCKPDDCLNYIKFSLSYSFVLYFSSFWILSFQPALEYVSNSEFSNYSNAVLRKLPIP